MTDSAPEETLSLAERRARRRHYLTLEPAHEELYEVLFRRLYAPLLRLGVVMLGSRNAAEDAVQDAFVALHRHRPGLRDPEVAEAYLRSAVLDRCRSRQFRPVAAIERGEAGPVAALRTLARRQREVLACRYVLELSAAETAQVLQISERSVEAHAESGLRALKQRIGGTS